MLIRSLCTSFLIAICVVLPASFAFSQDANPKYYWEDPSFDRDFIVHGAADTYVGDIFSDHASLYTSRWLKSSLRVSLPGLEPDEFQSGRKEIEKLAQQIGLSVVVTPEKDSGVVYDIGLHFFSSFSSLAESKQVFHLFKESNKETLVEFKNRFKGYDEAERPSLCKALLQNIDGVRFRGEIFKGLCIFVRNHLDEANDLNDLILHGFVKTLLPAYREPTMIRPSAFTRKFEGFPNGAVPAHDIAILKQLYGYKPGEQIHPELYTVVMPKMVEAVVSELSKGRKNFKSGQTRSSRH